MADPDRCHGLQETYENCQPNLIQYINFVLRKNDDQGLILLFAEVITSGLCKFVRTHMKQVVSRPAVEVTGYLSLEINYGNHRLMSILSVKPDKA